MVIRAMLLLYDSATISITEFIRSLLIELFKWVCSTTFGVRERVATFPAAPRSLDSPMEGNVHDDNKDELSGFALLI